MYLTAILTAKPDCLAPLREALVSLAEHSRRNPDTLHYQVLQSLENPRQILVQEHYVDAEALAAHLADPQVVAVLERFPDYLANPPQIITARMLA